MLVQLPDGLTLDELQAAVDRACMEMRMKSPAMQAALARLEAKAAQIMREHPEQVAAYLQKRQERITARHSGTGRRRETKAFRFRPAPAPMGAKSAAQLAREGDSLVAQLADETQAAAVAAMRRALYDTLRGIALERAADPEPRGTGSAVQVARLGWGMREEQRRAREHALRRQASGS